MPDISLCMIVKNEESILTTCLESIVDFVNEIIIVDTGSTDKTKEIALKYTNKIYDYKWNHNFSGARNFSLSKASNDCILVLDADEVVEHVNIDKMKELFQKNPAKVGRLNRINLYSREGTPFKYSERVNRFFSKRYFEYEGMIHEQVVSEMEQDYDTYNIPLVIKHTGYEGNLKTRKKKADRNINLLKNALKENPNDPYIIYQLGKSYYMAEDYNNSCDFFGQALYFDLDVKLEYVQDMVESYGYSLMNTKQYETALQLLNIYDEFAHSADFIFMIALVLMNNGRLREAINEFLKATKKKESKMEGVNDYLAYYNIGVIYECLGNVDTAKKYYLRCKNYKPAKQRLAEL